MTIYHGYDFSDYDYRDTERYQEYARLIEEQARQANERNRCTCIRRPGDDIRCPVHGGKK